MDKLIFKIKAKLLLGKLKVKRRHTKHLINQQEYRVFSQHREDGIIAHLLESIGDSIGKFVEFGFAPEQCNCLNLAINYGFSGLFMDGSEKNCLNALRAYSQLGLDCVQVQKAFLNQDNLNSLILESGINGQIDVLSIDVDGNDYWFWQSIVCIDPRIVVIEYNATFGPDATISIPYDPTFIRYQAHESGYYHGCSLSAIEHLGRLKGYRLVGVDETGVNAFLIKKHLCPNIPTLTPRECFKENRGRVKYKNQSRTEQLHKIKGMPLVDVTLNLEARPTAVS